MKKDKRKYSSRETHEYREWRLSVFQRDEYRCLLCGSSKNIHAHHIERYADNITGRTILSNGATVCRTCHIKYHNGWKGLFPDEITFRLIREINRCTIPYIKIINCNNEYKKRLKNCDCYWQWDRYNDKQLEQIDNKLLYGE